MRWLNKEEKNPQSQYRKLIRAQYQNSTTLDDGTIIMLDGPKSQNSPKLPDFGLSVEEIYGLSLLVDITKADDAVQIPLDFGGVKLPEHVYRYGYGDNYLQGGSILICPATMRPFLYDQKSHLHWKTCSENIHGPLNKQLSTYNYFIRYVSGYLKYPTKNEFVKFLADRQNGREVPVDTLPAQVLSFVDEMFEDYYKAGLKDISPAEFKDRTLKSIKAEDRGRMDGSC